MSETYQLSKALTDEELDQFIEDADRIGCDTWWVSWFCDEALKVANELKEWREADNARTCR